jgi:5-methylcytosine-specific restriction endonuclease McrA
MACECGCGKQTRIATRSWASRGYVAGQPKRFCDGHHLIKHGMTRRSASSFSKRAYFRDAQKRCIESNPATYIAKTHRYRANKVCAKGRCSRSELIARFTFFGWRCRYCRCQLDLSNVCTDHMIPLSRGGTNWPSNLVPCCKPCNSSKSDKTFFEFVALLAQKGGV